MRLLEKRGRPTRLSAVTSNSLAGKSIVIVGGTTGLGLSAARACAAAGAGVVIVGRNLDKAWTAAREVGPNAHVTCGDASDPATAVAAVEQAVKEFGRLDGLYHVAGGSGRRYGDGPLHELTDAGWEYTLRLNQNSVFYSNRAAVQQLLKQGTGGSILNMGSVLGFSPSPKHFATHAYASAKAAIIGLTKSAASYYAPSNVRFNVVAPALVDTPMAHRALGDEVILEFIKTKQPLDGGRVGRPDDLDEAVVYLLSDASKFVTGQVLTIDGGWSVTEGQYGEP
jgi:NAD(P)-dependent dehydrogenase (short-subunit alcohol dehydrogenase family)